MVQQNKAQKEFVSCKKNIESMRVGILTLKLHSNFGFIMQSYALQRLVRDCGHEPYHFFIKEEPETYLNMVIVFFKKLIKNCFYGTNYSLFPYYPTPSDLEVKDKNTWDFINRNIQLTPYIPSLSKEELSKLPKYDAYIVGSDQVWRREYTDNILCYYFNFVEDGVKRMSYAASFGKNKISYSKENKQICKELLRKFDYVTVREEDGVKICKEFFDCNASMVLDPTLLLTADKYLNLIEKEEKPLCDDNYIFVYILRPNKEKTDFVNRVSNDKGLKIINIMPKNIREVGKRRLNECIYPSISCWLKGFSEAKYIITDSFHASVFSIIFHKQFYVMNDNIGGASRINTLLKMLNLETRNAVQYNEKENTIDYEHVELLLKEKRERSYSVIDKFLNY